MIGQAQASRVSRGRLVGLATLSLAVCSGLALSAGQYERSQFWETEAIQAGWHADRQIRSGDCRLVDPDFRVELRGKGEQCVHAMRARTAASGERRHLVVLLHGLGRSSASFRPMARALREAGFEAVAVSYPSLKRSLSDHADQIAGLIERTQGVERVSFVTHSLGGLVVRELLSRKRPWVAPIEVERVVMLAPPNQGSALAQELSWSPLFGWAAGPSGVAIANGEGALLPAPGVEVGVIAGRARAEIGFNPWLDGNDDGIVSVEETRLAGTRDELTAHALHTFVMTDPEVVAASVRFIKLGRFAPEPRH